VDRHAWPSGFPAAGMIGVEQARPPRTYVSG
jgi:hypothetical protein